MSHVSMTQF
uniref:Uncharacterized protein n=1 Tax=Arundo donax TaxID=35708 RepID=A0A0A9BL59_ARUDO